MKAYWQNSAAQGSRDPADDAQAVPLLNKKKELRAHLREVDRSLRELETLIAGVISLAKEDLGRIR
jgi:hypothetical protein